MQCSLAATVLPNKSLIARDNLLSMSYGRTVIVRARVYIGTALPRFCPATTPLAPELDLLDPVPPAPWTI